jgi:hypothetical protein
VPPQVTIAKLSELFVVHNGSLRWVGNNMR